MYLTSPLPFRHQREPRMPKPLEILAVPSPRRDEDDTELATTGLPRSNSPLPSPTPPPPRSPLPPHKLANLANALGVNTPMPAFYRAPSPSGSSSFTRTPSKYLLHIVPPAFLPSEDNDEAQEHDGRTSVQSSGYRSQFRRGTLLPLYPTLQSQLGAIAREYNLPSTGGLVLYLYQPSQDGTQDGPRISDDVWKLLWHKALYAERQDSQPRSTSALNLRSGGSTPSSPFNVPLRELSQPLSAASSTPSFPYPSPLSASTPSSELHLPLQDRDNASMSDALSMSSEFTQNPYLPILAKIEFDIDRRKASWYNSWAHGRRERSRWRTAGDGGKLALELPERAQSSSRSTRKFRIDTTTHGEDSDYAILDDGEGDKTAVEEDEREQAKGGLLLLRRQDPLAEVFGHDGATWSEMHAGRRRKAGAEVGLGPSFPELVIPTGGEELEAEIAEVRDEEEVIKIWDENKRPKLPPLPTSQRKLAPPPLDLSTETKLEDGSSNPRGSQLPYLDGTNSESEQYQERMMKRRTGMVFGDLAIRIVAEPEKEHAPRSSQIIMKQKLDQLEKQLAHLSPRQLKSVPPPLPPGQFPFDANQPLRSAPPDMDKFNNSLPKHSKSSRSLNVASRRLEAPNGARSTDDPFVQVAPRKDSLTLPSHTWTPRSQEHKRAQSSQSSSGSLPKSQPEQLAGADWPAGSSSHFPPSPSSMRANGRFQDQSPPPLTLERPSLRQHKASPADDLHPVVGNPDSPSIPLSPDPFAKRSVEDLREKRLPPHPTSNESRSPPLLQSTALPVSVPEHEELETGSSRFSADSEQGVERLSKLKGARTSSVMSVRGLRNLWRKSGISSKGTAPILPAELSPSLPSPQSFSQHSRGDSYASQRSYRSPVERTRRPSTAPRPATAPRPDSGADPFQFDNSNIYKSPSSSSLASTATSPTPRGHSYVSATGSIGQSKGILKGWAGNGNPGEAETRKLRRPRLNRSVSGASASVSDLGERSADSQQSSPPSSPPDMRYTPVRRKRTPSPSGDTVFLPHSLPTASASGLSRYPEAFAPPSGLTFDDGATPRLTEFDIVSTPTRTTPSYSYAGEVC